MIIQKPDHPNWYKHLGQSKAHSGHTAYSFHLQEGEDEAHSEVGQPVEGSSNNVGSWAVGLFKQLRCDQEGNPRWNMIKPKDIRTSIQITHVALSLDVCA